MPVQPGMQDDVHVHDIAVAAACGELTVIFVVIRDQPW
jgi:hypothetical protein